MSTFEEVAVQQGWTPQTQVSVLMEYIRNQDSDEAFEDYLQQKMEDESDDDFDRDFPLDECCYGRGYLTTGEPKSGDFIQRCDICAELRRHPFYSSDEEAAKAVARECGVKIVETEDGEWQVAP